MHATVHLPSPRPLRPLLLLRPPPPHPATPSSWTPFLLSSSIVRNQSSRHRRSPRRRPRRSNARAECQLFLSLSLLVLPSRFACFLFPSVFRAPIRLSGSSPPSLPRRVTGGAGRARTLFQSMIVGRGWVGRGVSRRAERKWWRTFVG